MFEVSEGDKGIPKEEQKTYLKKLKEAFKEEGDLIKILANIGSNQLIQTLFAVPEGDKGKPKKNRKHIFKN